VVQRVVVDTSAILSMGSKILRAFPDGEVILPLAVVRELEKKRNEPLIGHAARDCLRELDRLRERGDLSTGVDNGTATIRVELNHISRADLPESIKRDRSTDTRILAVAKHLDATLISKDVPLRILASVIGVPAEDVPSNVKFDPALDALPVVHVDDTVIEALYSDGEVKADLDLPVNTAVLLRSHDEQLSALAIHKKAWGLKLVSDRAPAGVDSRSAEQRVAIDHLMDPDVKVVSLGGKAGTGKTMLALAAGIDQVLDGPYSRVVVFRSMKAVGGEDMGFLPGDVSDKFDPWLAAVYDALEAFLPKQKIERLKKEERIICLPLTHLRGRTFNGAYLVCDEAQNLEYATILTVLTRLGKNAKAVLTWDAAQRDNLRVGRHDGVAAVVQRLHGDKLFAHVALRKSERSEVAEMAARLLDDGR
jgi:PhoH-like ATPase